MPAYTLQRVDDPVTRYRLHADDARIGEVRIDTAHRYAVYAGERRAWLVRDDVADAAAGATLLARFAHTLRFNRRYSLRDAGQVVARAQRHWNPLRNRDWIDFDPGEHGLAFRATPRGLFSGSIPLTSGTQAIGEMRIVGVLRHRVALDCPGLDALQAALLMVVAHEAWGNDPYVGETSA